MYYGIYRGTCYDNADPENSNRIILSCPQVLGSTLSNWAPAINPVSGVSPTTDSTAATISIANVPNINQGVWVMFEG